MSLDIQSLNIFRNNNTNISKQTVEPKKQEPSDSNNAFQNKLRTEIGLGIDKGEPKTLFGAVSQNPFSTKKVGGESANPLEGFNWQQLAKFDNRECHPVTNAKFDMMA